MRGMEEATEKKEPRERGKRRIGRQKYRKERVNQRNGKKKWRQRKRDSIVITGLRGEWDSIKVQEWLEEKNRS